MADINILIVDDEEELRENLSDLIEDSVDSVTTAENGEEALKLVNGGHNFACIISDIQMPIMNGGEFIKAFRKFDEKTPFVFFTAHGNRELMLEAIQYGAFDFIDKPHFDNLFDVIDKVKIQYEIVNSSSEADNSDDSLLDEFDKIK
jgi:two-component system chemotaxis response regulator CheY